MKNHLKRIAAPSTWLIARRENTFILRPNAGGHPLEFGMSLGVILRDHLKIIKTMSEAKKVIETKEILVDGKRRLDHRCLVGLFDVISIPELKQQFRVILNKKKKLVVIEVPAREGTMKLCKIIGKSLLTGGKTQLHLHDGKNIIASQKVHVGDSIVLELPSLQIKEVLPLHAGSMVILVKGKHGGDQGILKRLQGKEASYIVDGQELETAKDHLFVVGNKEAVITVQTKNNEVKS